MLAPSSRPRAPTATHPVSGDAVPDELCAAGLTRAQRFQLAPADPGGVRRWLGSSRRRLRWPVRHRCSSAEFRQRHSRFDIRLIHSRDSRRLSRVLSAVPGCRPVRPELTSRYMILFFNTPFALGAWVLALESVPNPGAENWGIRPPEHHATLPDTSRSQTEDARLTFGHNPISE